MKSTRGGSSETLEKDWQVRPTGWSRLVLVTTVTPDAKRPRTSEPSGGRHVLGVVVDDDVLAGAELEVDVLVPSHELISSGLGQVSRASGLIPSGISGLGSRGGAPRS